MIFRSKRHFLSDQKIRFKMPKLPKRWLAVGITFLGLCLGIGISATQVQATPQPVQTVNSRAASSHQNSKEAIAPTNVLNSKASVKVKSPNSRLGSPFVPRVGLKDHLHNRCCTGNDCPCEENGDECTCEDSDDNCGCIDINKSDCECEWDFNCDCDDHCNECDDNGDSNDDYGTFKIKLNNKKKDIYWGRDYTVEGSITYNKTGNFNGPLHYYYEINGGLGERVEFQGPQSVGSNPETFKFTIPHEMMVLGKKYEIYVTVEDEVENEGDDSNAARLRLITPAKIKTVNKTYYVGDPFDQFGNFAGGLNVTNQPLTKEELTDTVIRDTNGKKVRNWNKITAKPGEYTITYIYKYGSDDECGCPDLFSDGSICKKANISVIDHKKITLKYVDESLNPIEDKYLIGIPKEMAPGDHSEGNCGSKFPLVKTPELSFNGKKYYEFVRFEYAIRPAPDLTEDYVTFGDHDQVINVVYRKAFAEAPIKVELINIKDIKDEIPGTAAPIGSTTVDPNSGHLVYTLDPRNNDIFPTTPKVDDPVTLTHYIEEYKEPTPGTPTPNTPRTKLMLPKGYKIAEEELKGLGLAQGEPRFGAKEVRTKFYVVKDTSVQFNIKHVVRGSGVLVKGLDTTNLAVKPRETFEIDTKNMAHQAPRGYKIVGASLSARGRVDRNYPYNPKTGLITGTVPNTTTDSIQFYILYDKY